MQETAGRTSPPPHLHPRFNYRIGHKLERGHKCGLWAMPMGGSTTPSLNARETLDAIAPTGAFRGIRFPPVVRMIGEAPPIAFCAILHLCIDRFAIIPPSITVSLGTGDSERL